MFYETMRDCRWVDTEAMWKEMTQRCKETQEAVLMDIINEAKDTAYGKAHHFDEIHCVEDYRRLVPLQEYEDLEPYILRIADDGEQDVLFPGEPLVFLQTSGTTGTPKLIPENKACKEIKALIQRVREIYTGDDVAAVLRKNPTFVESMRRKGFEKAEDITRTEVYFNNKVFTLTMSLPQRTTKAGYGIGLASRETTKQTESFNLFAYPMEILSLEDQEAILYLTMRFALCYDNVIQIAGNNMHRLAVLVKYAAEHCSEIVEDIRNGTITQRFEIPVDMRQRLLEKTKPMPERADELQKLCKQGKMVPKYYWPFVSGGIFWISGSMAANLNGIKRIMPKNCIYYDIGYGASEAKINIPNKPGNPYGALATFGAFYEFKRLTDGKILSAWELKNDEEYEIILSNYGGLYRYQLHDIVRVRGFDGNTPRIVFVTKSSEILDIAQEKVAAVYLDKIIRSIVNVRQMQVRENREERCYEVYLEMRNEEESEEEIAKKIDAYLIEKHPRYRVHREYGSITPLKVVFMPSGWKEHLLENKNKAPLLVKERPTYKG